MLAFVIENAPLSGVIAHTRFSKSTMFFYNPVIVFCLTSIRLEY